MKAIDDRRETDRKRQERYRKNQSKMGKKTITATISKDAYDALQAIKKESQKSNSAIVERALLALANTKDG